MKKQREIEYKQLEREYNNLEEYNELYLLKAFSIGAIIGMIPLGLGTILSTIGLNTIPLTTLYILCGGSAIVGAIYGAVKSIKFDEKRKIIKEKMEELEVQEQCETLVEKGVLREVKKKNNKIYYTFANQTLTQEELNQQINSCENNLENNIILENEQCLTLKK